MSISKVLASTSYDSFIIPCTSKLVRTNIGRNNSALCFLMNRGYFDTDTLSDMERLTKQICELDGTKLVGGIDKVVFSNQVRYRQRVVFNDLLGVMEVCKMHGAGCSLSDDFRVTIDSVIDCSEDLRYLQYYARSYYQTVDTFLTNTCKIQFSLMAESKHMNNPLDEEISHILQGKRGYMDRAPFLLSKYNLSTGKSAIFIPKLKVDKSMYNEVKPNQFLDYGYTEKMVLKDRKGGIFNGNKHKIA